MAPELELLERSARGDREAFGQIVANYARLVCSVAFCSTGNFAQSEEVGQEAFVAAWKQLPELRDRSKFKSWLLAITRNVARGAARKEPPLLPLEAAEETPAKDLPPDELTMNAEESAVVWRTLEQLPEDYREPLVLYYRQEQSVAEVAGALSLSEAAVKQRLSRGREMIREEMAARVERILKRSAPTAAFTLAVLGALPGVGAVSASAAMLGAAGKSAPVVAVKAGAAGALFGSLIGLAGGLFGGWIAWKNARFQSERDLMKRQFVYFGIFMTLVMAPVVAIQLGWKPWVAHPNAYGIGLVAFLGVCFVVQMVWIFQMIRKHKAVLKQSIIDGDTPLRPTPPVVNSNSGWEGRNWTSETRLLGLPLVQIASRRADIDPNSLESLKPATARAWIAFGDRAFGVLFAAGGFACGGIAFGGMAIGGIAVGGLGLGLVSFAGLAVGALALGGCAIGGFVAGGMAIGWTAFGGAAIAWRAAKGGLAVAHDYAFGGQAIAAHANDAAAKAFVEATPFFDLAESALRQSNSFGLLVGLGIPLVLMLVMFRRKTKK